MSTRLAAVRSAADADATDQGISPPGAAHGVFGTISDIGDALGPIAAGMLVAGLGYTHMFQVMAVLAIMMAIVFAIGTARQPSRA